MNTRFEVLALRPDLKRIGRVVICPRCYWNKQETSDITPYRLRVLDAEHRCRVEPDNEIKVATSK